MLVWKKEDIERKLFLATVLCTGIFVFIIVIHIGGQFNERLASLVASRSVFFCQIVYVNNVSVCSYGK